MKKGRHIWAIFLLAVCFIFQLAQPALAASEGEHTAKMYISAKAAILVDVTDDDPVILYEQNARDKMYPASITKVMTALLVLEAVERGELQMDQMVSGSENIRKDLVSDGSTQNIQPGELMSVEDLLYCTLVASANEACNILAEAVDGDLATFYQRMNQRAEELGCEKTNFINAHGLPDDDHYTTAYDIYLICREAMKYEAFQTICATARHTVQATNMAEERIFHTTNFLISNTRIPGYYYSYATGIKTGSTGQAGNCLAASATKDGRSLISVVLGAENVELEEGGIDRQSFSESSRLLKWGFSNFQMKTILETTELIKEIEVTLSQQADYVVLRPEMQLEAMLPSDADVTTFERTITISAETVEAPVEKGQVFGTITLHYKGQAFGPVNLVASNDVELSQWLFWTDRVTGVLKNPIVQLALLVIVVLILIWIVRNKLGLGKKHNQSYRRYKGKRRK